MENYLLLAIFGLLVGLFGTLIGAGGGFILTPALLLIYPSDNPETITSIALAVTFANALSGSIAYGRMKRINYRYGLMFAAASIPGAILGALTTQYVPRRTFDLILAVILMAGAIFIFFRPPVESKDDNDHMMKLSRNKTITGIIISFMVGLLASFLGIGGGIIHVPALSGILGFSVHIATATSHFILVFVTLTAVIVHIATGAFHHGVHRAIALAVGVVIGAQLGAKLSRRINGKVIIRILALALLVVAIRLIIQFFQG